MRLKERAELRQRVEDLHRDHPEWAARQIEAELKLLVPVAYGSWIEETARLESRLRAIQRWRGGRLSLLAGPLPGGAFPYVWPIGEKQREDLDPAFTPSKVPRAGSSRLFLYNCSPDVVRDVRIVLDGVPVGYAPAIPVGRFCEIPWTKVAALREASLTDDANRLSEHSLEIEFVLGKGMKEGRLRGTLGFDPTQGWRLFQAGPARSSEIE